MTDGAWQALPHKSVLREEDGYTYLSYTLEDDLLSDMLCTFTKDLPDVKAQDYRLCLQTHIQQHIIKYKETLLQQQSQIHSYLQQYNLYSGTRGTMKDFLSWGNQQTPDFSTSLTAFLKNLNIDTTQIEDKQLITLTEQMKHISLGDDITLHVETFPVEIYRKEYL